MPPWLSFKPPLFDRGNLHYDFVENTASITDTMPALLFLALLGSVIAFRPQRPDGMNVLRCSIIGAGVGSIATLSSTDMSFRFVADFLPLLMPAAIASVVVAGKFAEGGVRRWLLAPVGALLILAGVYGVWANFSLAIFYQRVSTGTVAKPDVRASYQQFQWNLKHLFDPPTPRLYRETPPVLPAGPSAGDLWFQEDCQLVQYFDGKEWQKIGRIPYDYHFVMTFDEARPGTRAPILFRGPTGAADMLAVRYGDDDTIVFRFDHWGAKPLVESLPWPSPTRRPI